MKILNYFFTSILMVLSSCINEQKVDNIEKWKKEIVSAEADFAKTLSEIGLEQAFLQFADQNAVLLRNDSIIAGKAKIENYLKGNDFRKLSWKPEFVEVSASGDLAYTYGYYQYPAVDSTGQEEIRRGVFHTVWKRQKDGSWKFVWD